MGRNTFHLPFLVGLVVFWNHRVRILHAYSSSPSARGSRPNKSINNVSPSSSWQERTVVLLYHKPANVVTSHVAEDSRPTVYDEVQSMKGFVPAAGSRNQDLPLLSSHTPSFEKVTGIRSKLHAIGRLDADTTGLLLLTNDGGLVHHVTNPEAKQFQDPSSTTSSSSTTTAASKSHLITKTYEALIMGHHDETSLSPLWEGVDIGTKYGGKTRPVEDWQILDHPNHKSTLVSITISEGRNRQVRRMFHALGSGVMKLKRTKIGDYLSLDSLEENAWRILSEQEVWTALGWESRTWTVTIPPPSPLRAFQDSRSGSKQRKQPPSLARNQQKRR